MLALDTDFKILGLLSIVIVWSGLLFLLHKWPGNKSMSFSLHAAQTKASQTYYLCLFLVVLPLFYLFMLRWFIPELELPRAFTYLVTIAILGQLVAAIVPAVEGRKEQIHDAGAYLMALAMIPLSILIALADVAIVVTVLSILSVLYMVVTFILYLFIEQTRRYYLYFQGVYIALLHIIILAATYSR